MKNNKSENNLSRRVSRLFVFAHMVMKRSPDVLHESFNLKEAYADYLYQSESAVKYDDKRKRNEQKRASALEGKDCKEHAHGTGTCISHHENRRVGIVPQICKQAEDEGEYQTFIDEGSRQNSHCIREKGLEKDKECNQRGDHKRCRQSVHTVRAVHNIDRCPYKNDGKYHIEPFGQGKGLVDQHDRKL